MLELFCSHSWDHSEHREGLHGLLEPYWRKNIDWRDWAVPEEHPLHVAGNSALANRLVSRIALADVVLAFAGIYSSYSQWIEFEVRAARAQGKPIIAVKPWAQQRLSQVVISHATSVVGWNGRSVREEILSRLPYTRWLALEPSLRASERNAELIEAMGVQRR